MTRFRTYVLLAPPAYVVHIVEESRGFVAWTRHYPSLFSPTFTETESLIANVVYFVLVLAAAVVCVRRPAPTLGLAVLAFFLANALFHVGMTVASGVYSPGTVTAVVVYLPLAVAGVYVAREEGLLAGRRIVAALLLGVVAANLPLRIMQRWV